MTPASPRCQLPSTCMKLSTLAARRGAWDRRPMTPYTRHQLLVLLVVLLTAGLGLAVGQWRRAHPTLVERVEQLERLAAPHAPESPTAQRRAVGALPRAAPPWTRPDLAWATWAAAIVAGIMLLGVRRVCWAAACFLVGVTALGALRGAAPPLPPDHVARLELPRIAHVEGRLAAAPVRWAPERTRLLIAAERVDGAPRVGLIQATVHGPPPPPASGQRIAAQLRPLPATR